MNDNTDHCIDICNKLLRGERSAVETYEGAIEKHGDDPNLDELRRIRQEHAEHVMVLEDNVRSMGGTPDTDSGAWGTFANAVQSAASLFGASSGVEALQNGERNGRKDYENAIEDEHVMPGCKDLIRTKLLPRTESHITTLERLQHAV